MTRLIGLQKMQVIGSDYVVIGFGKSASYLLDRLQRDEFGRVTQGHVVNGGWGPLKIHYDSPEIKKGEEYANLVNPDWQVDVPDDVHGDYNDIMAWAETQV